MKHLNLNKQCRIKGGKDQSSTEHSKVWLQDSSILRENFLPLGQGVGLEVKQYDSAKEEVCAVLCG